MAPIKILALLLVIAGTVGLIYGGFVYSTTTHDTNVGPLEISVTDNETFNIPVWASVAAIVVGVALLVVRGKGQSILGT